MNNAEEALLLLRPERLSRLELQRVDTVDADRSSVDFPVLSHDSRENVCVSARGPEPHWPRTNKGVEAQRKCA